MSYIQSLEEMRKNYLRNDENLVPQETERPRKNSLFAQINSVPAPTVTPMRSQPSDPYEGYRRVRTILDSLSSKSTQATNNAIENLADSAFKAIGKLGVEQEEPTEESSTVTPVDKLKQTSKTIGFTAPTDVLADREFMSEVGRVATKLGVSQSDLLTVIDFETGGSFDPAQRNAAGSSGTGLIQFMEATAKELGTSTAELAQMTRTEQMIYVDRYLSRYADKINSAEDLYMAILYPAALGKPDTFVLFQQGDNAYEPNKGLDENKDGVVTRKEATKRALMKRIV